MPEIATGIHFYICRITGCGIITVRADRFWMTMTEKNYCSRRL
uniref:Uncharacterized protein n=1 Tax=Klebsiella pneumoniae TaxID=573 RepID=A0A8B0SQL1_KLEPN|nr:hypothetical protein [Klebsiella pneumoniae]